MRRRKTCDGVPHHIRSGGHPRFKVLPPIMSSTRGDSLWYIVPYCRTDVYLHSFFPSGIRLWNQLPEPIASRGVWQVFTELSPVPDLEILLEINLIFQVQLTIILACGIFSWENGSGSSLLKYNCCGPSLSVISVQFDKEIILK